MTSTVYRLLQGFLRRNVGLYVFLGLVQFFMTSLYWSLRFDRAALPGAMLGLLGTAGAINSDSLVWRSVPLSARDAAIFRWWASAGLPGIFLTLVVSVDWASQRSAGFPMPDAARLVAGVAALWAGLGIWTALPPGTASLGRGLRAANPKAVLLTVASAVLAGYGLPLGQAAHAYALCFVAVGSGLLLFTAASAWWGRGWRWPNVTRDRTVPPARAASSTLHSGMTVVLLPLARQTVLLTVVAIATISSLRRVFPGADYPLLWTFYIGVSIAGFLLTQPFRVSIAPLRSLPLSANRLALFLQLFTALPAAMTFIATLLVNRVVPALGIYAPGATTAAFVILSAQTLVDRDRNPWLDGSRNVKSSLRWWMPLYQRLFWPAWLGMVISRYRAGADWLSWVLCLVGAGFCVVNHLALVRQLRSGIRPANLLAMAPAH